ncbi:MAG: DUF6316 family protein [Pseudomonadales bacterium]|jgi:hypothetical protein|nr:DUF6316 family protein [Pseudomonadales bacterium]
MSDNRLGEDAPPPKRSPRLYEENGEWYFRTREGAAMGPYATREEAEQGLADFIEFIQLAPLDTFASFTDALSEDGEGEQPQEGD